MTTGGATPTPPAVSRSTSRSSPTSTSSARQKKFHRHFSQVIRLFLTILISSASLSRFIKKYFLHIFLSSNLSNNCLQLSVYNFYFSALKPLHSYTHRVLKINKEKLKTRDANQRNVVINICSYVHVFASKDRIDLMVVCKIF